MPDARLVYVTAASPEEARRIATAAVEERLAACANILGEIEAVFFWNGGAQNERETALILKTAADRLDALTARIKALHSYDEPCVAALPIVGGSESFLAWIEAETRPDSGGSTPAGDTA